MSMIELGLICETCILLIFLIWLVVGKGGGGNFVNCEFSKNLGMSARLLCLQLLLTLVRNLWSLLCSYLDTKCSGFPEENRVIQEHMLACLTCCKRVTLI